MKEIVIYDILADEILLLKQRNMDEAMRIIRENRETFTSFYGIIFSDNYIVLGE